jgi:hypothetical protein
MSSPLKYILAFKTRRRRNVARAAIAAAASAERRIC